MSTPRPIYAAGRNARVAPTKPVPPIEEYKAWLDAEEAKHPTTHNRSMKRTASQFRRMAAMKRNGSTNKEIADAILWSPSGVYVAYNKLPDHLK